MSTVIPLEGGGYRLLTKGASEIILYKCTQIMGNEGEVKALCVCVCVLCCVVLCVCCVCVGINVCVGVCKCACRCV